MGPLAQALLQVTSPKKSSTPGCYCCSFGTSGIDASDRTTSTGSGSKLKETVKQVVLKSFRFGNNTAEGFIRNRYHGKCGPYGCRVRAIDHEINGHVGCLEVAAPDVEPGRAILYFHGGAHNTGSMWYYTEFLSRLSETTRTCVYAVDYRLAPENPYPAALDDALDAWAWLCAERSNDHIAIAGDSAGGNLCFALMVKLATAARPQPVACVALAPWLLLCPHLVEERRQRKLSADALQTSQMADPQETSPPSAPIQVNSRGEPKRAERKGLFVRTVQAVQDSILWRKGAEILALGYVGDADATDPLLSPLLVSDELLKHFPPLHLQADKDEPLMADSEEMFHRCCQIGVPAELKVYQNTHHIFQVNPILFRDQARDSMDRINQFLQLYWQPHME